MPHARVNDIDLYYEAYGAGDDVVVFAHGLGGNHLSWWQQIPAFERRYRCVVFDHRGFGASADAPAGPGIRAFVEDLRGLLDHLQAERAFVVGQSMGGFTALGFALAYPRRARAIVMADTTFPHIGPETRAMMRRQGEHARAAPDVLRGVAYSEAYARRDPEGAFLYDAISRLNPPRPGDFFAPHRLPPSPSEAELASLRVPVLFLCGADDPLFPPPVMEAASALIPGACLVVVPGAGHSVYWERPSAFNEAVLAFFAECGA
jgi:3-oxoadipate enol-lactonase